MLRGEISRISALGLNIGDGMIWIGVLCYALFSILLPRRPLMLGLPAFLTVIFFIGSVTTFPFHAWEIARGDGMPLTWIGLGAAIYVGLFASLFAQLFWAFGVARVGPTKAGYFIYLTPAFGAAIAITVLGESPGWYHLAGIIAIFTGIGLATGRTSRAASNY